MKEICSCVLLMISASEKPMDPFRVTQPSCEVSHCSPGSVPLLVTRKKFHVSVHYLKERRLWVSEERVSHTKEHGKTCSIILKST